ncbi:MAG: TraX family protein [Oscillospiraceae bacterium]
MELSQKKGLSAYTLKYIAIAAMLADHIAWAFVETASLPGIAMHFVGRITGPVMFYFIVEGYHHTHNFKKYATRLAVFAVLAYPAFVYFETGRLPGPGNMFPVGVIYTLFLGLLALRAKYTIRSGVVKAGAILGLFLLSVIGDWPLYGIAYILVFDAFRGSYKKQFLAGCGVVVFSLLMLVSYPWYMVVIQAGQFLPLLLLFAYNGRRGGGNAFSKWVFYIFYPLHLVAIGLVRWAPWA